MRILFADSFPEQFLPRLVGHTVDVQPTLEGDDLVSAISPYQVLVVRSTKVGAAVLAAGENLELVIRAGAGTNTIDVKAAAERGIFVCNVPGKNAIAVAELTMGLIASIDRRIPDNVAALRAGEWNKKSFSKADGLAGKSLAIVGLGEIGLAVADRAVAFDMTVRVADKAGRPRSSIDRARQAGVIFVPDDETLLASADIVSLHVPLIDSTRGLVNRDFLAKCQDGAWIINTSRGEVVNEPDLIEALDTRQMWAGLDVFDDEPAVAQGEFKSALARHPRVYGTHHIGASTEQAQNAIAEEVVAIVDRFVNGEITNCVNLVGTPLGTCTVAVRHLDKVGVLSEVFGVLRAAQVNIEQMNNQIFQGAVAAVATLRTSSALSDEVVGQLRALENVLGVTVQTEE
ncbi:MAG: NAD(P)-binding domain-containing protein [Acidimicrobiia bacterium]|nr:NAD(P)-binding domain-containing protein [Acidimicrobiia bacterium]MDH5502663.1 NAD(P)-binding domain-containing protein [Acidimicrobiia bacterium]